MTGFSLSLRTRIDLYLIGLPVCSIGECGVAADAVVGEKVEVWPAATVTGTVVITPRRHRNNVIHHWNRNRSPYK